jgi:CRISPR-associated endonuclease/helicase Cas3
MKPFKSFEELIEDFNKISSDFVINNPIFKAHTPKQKNQIAETLAEHIEKVNQYALKLIEANKLDKVVDGLIIDSLSNQNEFINLHELSEYVKCLFARSIIFHDYGKINPNFQVLKMSNKEFFKLDDSIKIESQHSALSAFIFIHYHIQETIYEKKINSTERKFLWGMIFLFANPIFYHHSPFFEHKILPFEESVFNSLKRFLNEFKIETKVDNLFKPEQLNQVFSSLKNSYQYENYFPIFALLKLNFSILTASDYYSTNDYCNGYEVNDFGLIDSKLRKDFIYNFWEKDFISKDKENYNKKLLGEWAFYKTLSFKELEIRSNQNLNHLRQKMLVEAIENIRANKDKNLFYLEAPTGAGKTNLSIAVALELLKENESLNKIFYVFPFNTLISQTYSAVKDVLGLSNNEIVQLHSKSGFHEKDVSEEQDAIYGKDKLNFIDNLFINFPITLFSHIKFFDILKGNNKDTNYILHRLSNSIVIIDELQSYNPKHWDKVIFFLANYARYFNIKVILMSATLPKIDELEPSAEGQFIRLVNNKNDYFTNINFRGRVKFDFSLLKWDKPKNTEAREEYLLKLKNFLIEKAEERFQKENIINVLIEFIKKKTAGEFLRLVQADERFKDYECLLISGEILETRRREIINAIKAKTYKKVLLITTQVVEAGVDIDMDLGFKDKSLIDSDEQLAGRINRNASKNDCVLYIFDFDQEAAIYGKDERFKAKLYDDYESILENKDFDKLYKKVTNKIKEKDKNDMESGTLTEYKEHFKNFKFAEINKKFKLIEEDNASVFVPLPIPYHHFTDELETLKYFDICPNSNNEILGKDVWSKYIELMESKFDKTKDYISNQVQLKKFQGLLSKFMFSVYEKDKLMLREYSDIGSAENYSERYGILYLVNWQTYNGDKIYTYEGGLNLKLIKNDCML